MSVNADKPHKAVLLINVEVFEVRSTGECESRTVSREELAQYNIKPKFTKTVNGYDKHDCLQKLKTLLEQFETK
jgi:hypothetical protein